MHDLQFRQFLELVEKQPDYFDALKKLGIPADTLNTSPQMIPWIGFGKDLYNITPALVKVDKDSSGNPSAGRIKVINDPANVTRQKFSKIHGKNVEEPDARDDNEFHPVKKKFLIKALTKDLTSAGSGAMPPPSMGGMGMGGGL